MAAVNYKLLSFFFLLFLLSAVSSEANIIDFDETWQKRAEIAKERARAAYEPDPFAAARSFNEEVAREDRGGKKKKKKTEEVH